MSCVAWNTGSACPTSPKLILILVAAVLATSSVYKAVTFHHASDIRRKKLYIILFHFQDISSQTSMNRILEMGLTLKAKSVDMKLRQMSRQRANFCLSLKC
jgi:hypothetical protein